MDFTTKTTAKFISGKNCIENNSNLFSQFGKKGLIVTGKSSAFKSGALSDVENALVKCGIEFDVFDKISENPLVSTVIKAGDKARTIGAEFIVGIGGGSPLDAAKAVAICARNPEFDIKGLYTRNIPAKALPVILVGTTSGTGSEVTGVSVLTNDEDMTKKSISGIDCYAQLSFLDPKYTYSMNYDTTVSTALDAFAHAVEGWFSKNCDETAESYAKKALPLIYKGLKYLNETRSLPDESIRDELYYGSVYAGLELNICGAAFPHTVGYILTENFNIPHGKACTAFMPHFLNRAKKQNAERFLELLRLLGENEIKVIDTVKSLTGVENLRAAPEQIKQWCSRWGEVKNFNNTPGGFSASEAEIAIKELC